MPKSLNILVIPWFFTGGDGGSVIVQVRDEPTEAQLKKKKNRFSATLYEVFKKEFRGDSAKQKLVAGNGENSTKYRLNGPHGEDKILQVSLYFLDKMI